FVTQGDGLCAAFATAPDALAAAMNAQRRLAAEPWRETGPLGVRMALHAGAAEVENGTYVGACLNRLPRLLAAAHRGQLLGAPPHGGQLAAPPAGAAGARGARRGGVGRRARGARRRRARAPPERAYQSPHPALSAEFPPLRSLDAIPNNLPAQATPFIGREQQ